MHVNDGDDVHVGFDGIHVKDRNGEVHVSWQGIHVQDKRNDKEVHIDKDGIRVNRDEMQDHIFSRGKDAELPLGIIALVSYIVIGFCFGLWHPGWLIFQTGEKVIAAWVSPVTVIFHLLYSRGRERVLLFQSGMITYT